MEGGEEEGRRRKWWKSEDVQIITTAKCTGLNMYT